VKFIKTTAPFAVGWSLATLITLVYNNWLLQPLLNPALPFNRSVISEISARTQPYHAVFQTLDIVAGLLTLTAVPFIWRFATRRHLPLRWLLVSMVALLGADSILDASLAINCAPSIDAHCSLVGTTSLITQAHMIESTATGVATLLAPLIWWFACRKKARALAHSSWIFAVIQIGVGVSIIATRWAHIDVVGTAQRLYELGIGGWIGCVTAYSVMRRKPQAMPVPDAIPTEATLAD
jgi:hypothetical protein